MIIVTQSGTPEVEIERIIDELSVYDGTVEKIVGKEKVVIGLVSDTSNINLGYIQQISPFIEDVFRVEQPFKRASLEYRNGEHSEVVVQTPNGAITFGRASLNAFGQNHPLVVVAGPCSVENEEMIVETAKVVKATGAQFLRGGAYKPRSSPYAFQGHGESALHLLAKAREVTGLGIITEVMDTADLDKVAEIADVVQIGARNMQNFSLLKKAGAAGKPILLKRGMSATIEEWLMAAEYILSTGNPNVILCERGIRSFDKKYTRNVLDLSIVPVLRTLTHLPIMVDPSHATGYSKFVPTMAKAAIAAGTDSLMIEVHPNPAKALSDGPQSLTPGNFVKLMREIKPLSEYFGRGNGSVTTPSFVSEGGIKVGV
ncbi:MAG: 3-deoxy-7-phosphoheptulonate synthase [Rivularia sp. (in: cyanobacteria)]